MSGIRWVVLSSLVVSVGVGVCVRVGVVIVVVLVVVVVVVVVVVLCSTIFNLNGWQMGHKS